MFHHYHDIIFRLEQTNLHKLEHELELHENHELMFLCLRAKMDLCHIHFNVVNCKSFNVDSTVKTIFLYIYRVAFST